MNARIGTATHQLLHDFETCHQRFRLMGIDDYQAHRLAMAMTLMNTGACSKDEAWSMTNEIIGPPAQTTNQGRNDGD